MIMLQPKAQPNTGTVSPEEFLVATVPPAEILTWTWHRKVVFISTILYIEVSITDLLDPSASYNSVHFNSKFTINRNMEKYTFFLVLFLFVHRRGVVTKVPAFQSIGSGLIPGGVRFLISILGLGVCPLYSILWRL